MWKSQRLLCVPSSGVCFPSLQESFVRTGKWMQMLRISAFRIASDDRISTELTGQKIRHTSWKCTFILVSCHSLRRLIPVEYYRGLFDIKRRKKRSSGQWHFYAVLSLSISERIRNATHDKCRLFLGRTTAWIYEKLLPTYLTLNKIKKKYFKKFILVI
jgi:hypothetical protein